MVDSETKRNKMAHEHACSGHTSANPSVSQSLQEMEFERGIWPAAMDGESSRVDTILRKGTAVDSTDSSGYTALHYASRGGHLDICRRLLNSGANVNCQTKSGGATSLQRAAYQGHLDVVSLLLEKGAKPELCDSDGKTALHKAAEKGHLDIIKVLLEFAPDTKNIKDNKGMFPSDYMPENQLEVKTLLSPS